MPAGDDVSVVSQFSLRWRTEDEVVSGAGETTCGNTRCPFHITQHVEELHPALTTLELPFSYVEDDESKFALVKVVLCSKCVKKLMYKRNKEKQEQAERAEPPSGGDTVKQEPTEVGLVEGLEAKEPGGSAERRGRRSRRERRRLSPTIRERRPRNSRSRSPNLRREGDSSRRSP